MFIYVSDLCEIDMKMVYSDTMYGYDIGGWNCSTSHHSINIIINSYDFQVVFSYQSTCK